MVMSSLHHVELCCRNASPLLRLFVNGLGFRPVGARATPRCRQWALRSGQTAFVITQKHTQSLNTPSDGRFVGGEPWTMFCCGQKAHRRDSVFNVALRVRDVAMVTDRALEAGGRVLQSPVSVEDAAGRVSYSVVGSLCGDVVHTLVNTDQYSGPFLPGFTDARQSSTDCELPPESAADDSSSRARTEFVDHITLVCGRGEGSRLERWYSHVFGMSRFPLNRQDTPEEGVVFSGDIQMALKAMQYWQCAETGLTSSPVSSNEHQLKLVIAESLHPDSLVETFLRQHGSGGVQHIGLHSSDIVQCVQQMVERGVEFRKPPAGYYGQIGKGNEIRAAGITELDRVRFQELGLLLDAEADQDVLAKDRYLVQVFSKPLFEEDTFFMEVLERRGARGFGQGNIDALARSILDAENQAVRG